MQMARLPGVLAVEPFREVPVRIRNGNTERRIMISGRPHDADLKRIIDVDLRTVMLPETGLAISGMLGRILGVGIGDTVEVDLLEGARRTVSLPVVAFGIRGMMDMQASERLMREAPAVNSVNLSLDDNRRDQFYAAIKSMPTVSGVALQRTSLATFRKTVALLITTMASIYTGWAPSLHLASSTTTPGYRYRSGHASLQVYGCLVLAAVKCSAFSCSNWPS